MNKEIICIDMDGVLVDFGKAKKQFFDNYSEIHRAYRAAPTWESVLEKLGV